MENRRFGWNEKQLKHGLFSLIRLSSEHADDHSQQRNGLHQVERDAERGRGGSDRLIGRDGDRAGLDGHSMVQGV